MFPFTYEVNLAGWFHLVYLGVLIPILAMRSGKKLAGGKQPLPNRLRHFKTTAFTLAMFAVMSLMVARVQWIELFPRTLPSFGAIMAGVAMYGATVVFMRPRWRRAVEKRTRIVHLFMPDNSTERAWWIAVSVLAGVGEEITWRGVQAALVTALTGNYGIAVLVCSISFGVAHWVQGWKSAGIIFFFALGFHSLVWLAGSLYVAMVVHVAYDITAGLNYAKLGRELGFALETSEPKRAVVS